MSKMNTILIILLLVLVVAGWYFYSSQNKVSSDGEQGYSVSSPFLKEYVEWGKFDVGLMPLFFHDKERSFDGWNAVHASDEYKAVLKEINDAGDRHIVSTNVWYPIEKGDTSGRKATFTDLSKSKSKVFSQSAMEALGSYLFTLTTEEKEKMDKSLAKEKTRDELAQELFSDENFDALVEETSKRIVNARYEADIAQGTFPVVVLAHGLGGTSAGWSLFAEYLASNGYIVVAPSFASDSSLPNVLDSPDSKYYKKVGKDGLDKAYNLFINEDKVINNFFKYFYGSAPSSELTFGGLLFIDGLKWVEGGEKRVGDMMAGLFTQRVADVATIIDGLESLNKERNVCESDFESNDQKEQSSVCGFFANSIDLKGVGVAGQSLGSMTAQFSLASNDKVVTAVGYNNGPPRYWEPEGIFGEGVSEDGQPIGNRKPVMQIHGSEDGFVQAVFRGIMWNTVVAAGGDPKDIWVLEKERVLPTDENPQPVARNAYNRAVGDKMIISVKDLRHDDLVEDFPSVASELNPIVINGKKYWSKVRSDMRKPVGDDVLKTDFAGEPYMPIGWDKIEKDSAYLPTFIKNYYTKNWLDYYLKKDENALSKLYVNPLRDKGVLDIRSSEISVER
ncbi:MAG: hypothetical protein OXU73_01450 [Candidatus Campbellbacteria bacterium]|nr:hypothetical protein [Candidatus Campbellbacteria bacterium]